MLRHRCPRDLVHIVGVLVAPWRCHLEQHRKLAGHHQVARRCGREHEPPATLALLERKLLRERAAPRDAQHVHLLVSQLIEQPGAQPRQRRRTVRQARRGRAADARHVEDDHLGTVERVEKGLDQLDAGADSVEEKQRRRAPSGRAERRRAAICPADVVQADLHLFLHDVAAGRCVERRILVAAKLAWRRAHLTRARLDPLEPVRPPASSVLGRAFQPRLGARFARRAGPEYALGLPGGLSRLWIWPLLASTNVLRSP